MGSKAGAAAKLHMVDTGVAASAQAVTTEKLANRLPAAMTQFGHLLETFVVNEVLKQVSWIHAPITVGHWHDRGGAEVGLVLESQDGKVLGIEVKSASRAQPGDTNGLKVLAGRPGDRWLGGVVFYTGRHGAVPTAEHRIIALPVDALWS